ncbi:hypothetical protein Pse7367_3236 [Thalassoporum mexicanum PCC 7367]|uniref:DUF3082 domain-containing protein n=1 Tax=Thalassoporum mexicanum TaxID=3457544 RepID=UPI00029FF277|nr:DUF3082 domain-containing protein [Pseudanabaena sp. PCC 7367]AFY71481.1 hypothetical protein Pse7367_3236 [Pseudanabaena sp. PCC 7367]
MSQENSPAIPAPESDLEQEATSAENVINKTKTAQEKPKAPPSTMSMVIQNLSGVLMAGAIAVGLYFFTNSVAVKLAQNPITSSNTLAMRVSTTVRTFLLALGTGATMIFGVVALGIFLLTIQEVIKRGKKQQS